MMRRTRTTSTRGTILISESDVPVCLLSCGIAADFLGTHFFNLRRNFHGEIIHARREIPGAAHKMIVSDDGGNGGEKSSGRGNQSFGDAGSNGAEAGRAGGAEAGEGVHNAPDSSEQSDEWRNGSGGGEPGHIFFNAPDLIGGGKLHADHHGLQTFDLVGRFAIGQLQLNLSEASVINMFHGGSAVADALWFGKSAARAEDAEELCRFPIDFAKHFQLLENERPGKNGEGKKDQQNGACNPTGLLD